VTFEQIDPLFVIDLATTNPTVLGELKIPWYSTYLHPYGDSNGKTYLIWLGYDVDNSNGRTINSGIKLDLYEIDYWFIANKKITIKQVQSSKIGWPGTESEALWNPRMFVYDEFTKTVYLPLVRTIQDKVRYCPTVVYEDEPSIESISVRWEISVSLSQCYDSYNSRILFAGYKWVQITPQAITQTKIVDYTRYYWRYAQQRGYDELNPWQIQSLSARVWYAGGKLWYVNNWFMRTEKK
jgi:hypothetical protein